ncbi:MAG: DUF881 domain-containing protein [Anaerolineae bacterium]|nr:DUF881 domain-containing protein [Anaerolineae bacterium]
MVMLIAALLLGILVSVQWPTIAAQSISPLDPVSYTIHELELEQDELKRTIIDLRAQLNQQQQEAAGQTSVLLEVRQELTLQKMRAGLTDLRGPGIRVVLADGARSAGGDADGYIVHDYDIRDVVNVLWMAGAEAISVNGERIVNTTSIYCVGSTVMVNDTRLSPPYKIRAIGDSMRLQDHLRNPGYLVEIKERVKRFGIELDVIQVEMMTVPAYHGGLPQRYARPGS